MEAVRAGPQGPMSSKKMVALAAGLSVGAAVGYVVYQKMKSTTLAASMASPQESRMSVPLEVYRNIAKYQASFLDLVIQKSGAQVRVLAGEEALGSQNAVSLLLQGSPQQVLLARCTLENLATDCETITDVLEVPQTAFGRIIGRGGESLKLITRTTGARVTCPRERGRGLEEKGTVSITGTRQEVRQAKELVMEKVLEDDSVRRKITQSSALRQRRRKVEPHVPNPEELKLEDCRRSLQAEENVLLQANSVQTTVRAQPAGEHVQLAREALEVELEEDFSPDSLSEVSKFEIPSPDLSFQPDEHLEVYVSASENPNHFWIQILGVRSLQLDKLTQEMSRFYNNGNLQEQRVETIVVGDIVAAPYRDHGTWNRAKVLGVLASGLVDLYYVDFGDNGELPRDSLRSMRSDFLSLPFQAIECSLAGVKPTGDEWSEEALDEFDRLTYVAEWRPLLAKLCSYSHSEVSSWPSVQLYDNKDDKTVDLGEELVRLGHAIPSQCNGRAEQDNPGLLQRMLDDVTGATSELSLSCISLSGTGHRNEERGSPWSSGSVSSLELQRADVDHSPTTGFGFGLAHSTPARMDLVSHIVESSSSSQQPLSPDHQVPSSFSVTFNRTNDLYTVSMPFLQLTHTLPMSSLTSSSCTSSSCTSSSCTSSSCTSSSCTTSSPLVHMTSALGLITLSDNVFLEGSSYDGDEECEVTSSSGEVETTGGNSTWSFWSSDRGYSLEEDYGGDEVDKENSSEGAVSISSTPTFPTQEHSSLGKGEEEHGHGEDCAGDPSVVEISSGSSMGSDVICMGLVEPGWGKGQSVPNPADDGCNGHGQPRHLSMEATDTMNTMESQIEVNEVGRTDKLKSTVVKKMWSETLVAFHPPENVSTERERSGIAGLQMPQCGLETTVKKCSEDSYIIEEKDQRHFPLEF
ncbi:hypothetical protein UPYG_G00136760 [Umbra pygmaea]|uniref:Tudor domain-containing protein n=1 Tax=Umbra pygmaea TaxID=75934 RepID=A0ABD0WVT9_UMBPY